MWREGIRKLVMALLVAALAPFAWGQAYKWRDASGRIQYSDTPPPPGARDVQKLSRATGAPTGSASAARKSVAEQDAEFRKRMIERQEAQAKAAKAEEDERIRERNCAQAKGQLAGLESGARMVQMNAKGEPVPLDDAERERARQDAIRAVESWCKEGR